MWELDEGRKDGACDAAGLTLGTAEDGTTDGAGRKIDGRTDGVGEANPEGDCDGFRERAVG